VVSQDHGAGEPPRERAWPGARNAGPVAQRIPRRRGGVADQARLRSLAGRGELGGLTEAERAALRPAAFEVAHAIVYDVVTRRVARGRGHGACGLGLRHLGECCLDGFHRDLEAVVELLLASTQPIADLEGWLAKRAPHAAVDGYRRRRGETGALQRPRMTKVLEEGLDNDPWLCHLALKMLAWVGVPAGVGATFWPLDAWAWDRGTFTGDYRDSTPARVLDEVNTVLAVMRRRPEWFRRHVEAPLERKVTPVGGAPGECAGDPRPLLLIDPGEAHEDMITGLAAVAVEAIRAGLGRGEDATTTVVTVLTKVFVSGTGAEEIARGTGGGPGPAERLSALFGDPAAVSVLVQQIVQIVRGLAD
jgi:hypothetical protein